MLRNVSRVETVAIAQDVLFVSCVVGVGQDVAVTQPKAVVAAMRLADEAKWGRLWVHHDRAGHPVTHTTAMRGEGGEHGEEGERGHGCCPNYGTTKANAE